MGDIQAPTPVLLLIAVSSRYDEALLWARERAIKEFGPVRRTSPAFDFTETDYYDATMGKELKKQFFAFERVIDPEELASIKCLTNDWEAEYSAVGHHAETRPLNLDPGYLTLAKLVLASTKDHAHRIYLKAGIYAEVTLNYRAKQWSAFDWTYPDYRRVDYQQFFSECRETLRS